MKPNIFHLVALLLLSTLSTLASADPSGRVGRISDVQGTVTFRNTEGTGPAMRNWPITSGNTLSTTGASRAEIRVGSAAVRLDGNTELEIVELDDNRFHLRLGRGSAVVHIRNTELARDVDIDTPQGHIVLSEPSQLRVDVRDDAPVTMLSVLSGSASFDGPETRFAVPAGRRAEVAGNELRIIESSTALRTDNFDQWSATRDRAEERSASARYVSAETTGYEELDTHGEWRVTSLYGPVWSPRVIRAGWAPYRDGRWTWVAPWGWTWVDNAPWGYAPSHYGRWVWLEQRWGWVPGVFVARPVWAPALVGWVGGSGPRAVYAVGAAPSVGWFPLAPREAYVPAYRVSPRYVQQINTTVVKNVVINERVQVYQNRNLSNAVTVMPHAQFVAQKIAPSAPPHIDRAQAIGAAPVSAAAPQLMATLPSRQLPAMQPVPASTPVSTPASTPTARDRQGNHEQRVLHRRGEAFPHENQGRRHQQSGIERHDPVHPAQHVAAVPAMQSEGVAVTQHIKPVLGRHQARQSDQIREHRSEREKSPHRREHPDR